LGQGNGHFGLPETFYLGVSPRTIGTGDFLGTGRTDVAIEGTYFDDQLEVVPSVVEKRGGSS
jgi:hypothetical protein